jgi:hypothetical protein
MICYSYHATVFPWFLLAHETELLYEDDDDGEIVTSFLTTTSVAGLKFFAAT